MEISSLIALAVFFAACFATASSGAVFKPGLWYENLKKPRWNPPNWAFPVVWTILFIMMAVAGWLVWQTGNWPQIMPAMAAFGLQLVLNAAWSAIFFGLKQPGWALAEVALLWAAIFITILLFIPVSSLAALLLLPYLIWVSIASALNYSIWKRNRKRLVQA